MGQDDATGGGVPALPRVTERLVLRAHRLDDLDDLCRFHGDPDVVRYVPWPVRDRAATAETLQVKTTQGEWFEPGRWLVLAIEERVSSRVVGEVLLKWTSEIDRTGELGFALAADAQGRGLAREAAAEVLRMAFEDLSLHRVTAVCVEQNTASARLLARLGFEREGRCVDSAWFKGCWVTQLMFAITEDRWRAGQIDLDLDLDPDLDPDVRAVLAVVDTFFAAFTSGPGTDDRLAGLRALLLDDAVIVRTCGQTPAAYDVEAFLEPRRTMLTDGSLVDFSERAIHGRVDVFGDIACWFGAYTKSGSLHGAPYGGAGMKSLQLVRMHDGWRVSAAAWDDERPGLAADDHTVHMTLPDAQDSST